MFEQRGLATKKLPRTIYHYCDLNAFLNIIKTKKLWLSSANCMNDPTEVELFYSNLESRNKCVNNPLIEVFTKRNRANAFLCCFSSNGDLLSQWRAYGDDGEGIAIGFDGELLESSNKYHPIESIYAQNGLFIQPVNYGTNVSDEFFDELQDRAKELIESTPNNTATDLFYYTDFMSIFEKNEYYKEEDEIRAVYFPIMGITDEVKHLVVMNQVKSHGMSEQKYRVSNGKIVPYFEWDLTSIKPNSVPLVDGKQQIQKIIFDVVLGPKCAMSVKEVKYIIDNAFFSNGKDYYEINVRRSSGKYR